MIGIFVSKKGESTLFVIAVILALLLILSVIFVYAKALVLVEDVAGEVRECLDKELLNASLLSYGSLKKGTANSLKDDLPGITSRLQSYLGSWEEGQIVHRDSYGDEIYRLTNLIVTEEEEMWLKASFTICLPIRMGKSVYGYAEIPLTVGAYFVNEEE